MSAAFKEPLGNSSIFPSINLYIISPLLQGDAKQTNWIAVDNRAIEDIREDTPIEEE
jgi:hypothetical protein